jgi:hypothetical protein
MVKLIIIINMKYTIFKIFNILSFYINNLIININNKYYIKKINQKNKLKNNKYIIIQIIN